MTPKQDGFKLSSFCKRCHVLSHGNTVFVYSPVRKWRPPVWSLKVIVWIVLSPRVLYKIIAMYVVANKGKIINKYM